METARSRLARHTAEAHQDVENTFNAFGMDSLLGYGAFLQAQASVIVPWEKSLHARFSKLLPTWNQRRRAEDILKDLHDLRLPVLPVQEPPSIGDAGLWGVLYVLEGSKLGGTVLHRRVCHALPEAPLRFLSHSGQKLWPALIKELEDALQSEDSRAEACTGAALTFEAFRNAGCRFRPADRTTTMIRDPDGEAQ